MAKKGPLWITPHPRPLSPQKWGEGSNARLRRPPSFRLQELLQQFDDGLHDDSVVGLGVANRLTQLG